MLQVSRQRFDTNIEQVVEDLRRSNPRYFSKVRRSGEYLMVTCPYHKGGQERKPSAQFRDRDGLFYCHACKQAHSLPDVIQHVTGIDGWTWLRDHYPVQLLEQRKLDLKIPSREPKPDFEPDQIPESELESYRCFHDYILSRGISREIVRKFDVGYDAKHDCVTFPIRDRSGRVLFVATRSIRKKFFHYPEGVKKPVYGFYEIDRERRHGVVINEIYIVESIIDALSIWTWGRYAVALQGLGNREQIAQLDAYPVRSYILATDNDDSGRQARERLRSGIKHKIVRQLDYASYGDLKDINEFTPEQFFKGEITW